MTITLDWWLLPLAITIASMVWTFWPRKDERRTGQMFDGLGRAMGEFIRFFVATTVSLSAWLVWAVLT